MNTYTDDELNEIQLMASEGMTAEQIAILLDLDREQFKKDVSNPISLVHRHYLKGITTTAREVIKQEVSFAKSGSVTAMKNYLQILKKQIRDAQG